MINRITAFLKTEKERLSEEETGVLTIILCVAEEGRIINNLLTRDL